MRNRTNMVVLLLVVATFSFSRAKEPDNRDQHAQEDEVLVLRKRVAELEDRLARLEDLLDELNPKIARQDVEPVDTPVADKRPSLPPTYPNTAVPYVPRARTGVQPPVNGPPIPSVQPPNPWRGAPATPGNPPRAQPVPVQPNSPPNWQKLEINGQTFYVVPASQVWRPVPDTRR